MTASKNILIITKQDHLQRGYFAVLQLEGYIPHLKADCGMDYLAVLVDTGAKIHEYSEILEGLSFDKIIFIVPAGWRGEIPKFSGVSVLQSPVSAATVLALLGYSEIS